MMALTLGKYDAPNSSSNPIAVIIAVATHGVRHRLCRIA